MENYGNLEPLYDETNDDFCDRETEEYPDYVRQFTERQERNTKAEKIFAAKVVALLALTVIVIFYICLTVYN